MTTPALTNTATTDELRAAYARVPNLDDPATLISYRNAALFIFNGMKDHSSRDDDRILAAAQLAIAVTLRAGELNTPEVLSKKSHAQGNKWIARHRGYSYAYNVLDDLDEPLSIAQFFGKLKRELEEEERNQYVNDVVNSPCDPDTLCDMRELYKAYKDALSEEITAQEMKEYHQLHTEYNNGFIQFLRAAVLDNSPFLPHEVARRIIDNLVESGLDDYYTKPYHTDVIRIDPDTRRVLINDVATAVQARINHEIINTYTDTKNTTYAPVRVRVTDETDPDTQRTVSMHIPPSFVLYDEEENAYTVLDLNVITVAQLQQVLNHQYSVLRDAHLQVKKMDALYNTLVAADTDPNTRVAELLTPLKRA